MWWQLSWFHSTRGSRRSKYTEGVARRNATWRLRQSCVRVGPMLFITKVTMMYAAFTQYFTWPFDKSFNAFDKSFDAFDKPLDAFDKHLIHSIDHFMQCNHELLHSQTELWYIAAWKFKVHMQAHPLSASCLWESVLRAGDNSGTPPNGHPWYNGQFRKSPLSFHSLQYLSNPW